MTHQSHQTRDTAVSVTVGLEDSVRQSWCAGYKVKILSSISKQWVTAHIVTIHKDWLYCLLEDGDTKKIDRWDASVQPVSTTDGLGGEDDDDIFWLKDGSTQGGDTVPTGQSMSLGFNTLAKPMIEDDFSSTKITASLPISPRSKEAKEHQFEQSKMCGYTIWVQWCDSSELHGFYQCVGLRNNRYHFKQRKDSLAELFADNKGYWYLMYDGKCLYKSKKKGFDDPPPRNYKCIEGSLPPPGISQVALPDDARPMVIIEDKKDDDMIGRGDTSIYHDDDDTASDITSISRQTTVKHGDVISPKSPKYNKKKERKKKKKKDKEKVKLITKLFNDEFDVDIEVLDFHFDGTKQVAFHLNIGRHMEVTKVKEGGQAMKLGVIQGDILFKINLDDVSKNWEKATNLLRSYVASKEAFTITFIRRKVENLLITIVRAGNSEFNGKYKFYCRDKEDEMCPIYVKNDDMDMFADDNDDSDSKMDLSSPSLHLIQRVYSNPENSEALWVIKNGGDEHYYMCVTNEYLPPQHGWELVPDSAAQYPAPGLQFTSTQSKYGHVNRLRGYTDHDNELETRTTTAVLEESKHDVLNITNRNRTNKHRHEKTLTRMRQTLGSTNEFNQQKGGSQRSATGGGFMPSKPGMAYAVGKMGGARGGFGSKLFGSKKQKGIVQQQQQQQQVSRRREESGNQSASETEEDSAKIEAIWKSKLEETTKKAINQLATQHKSVLSAKDAEVSDLSKIVNDLRMNHSESCEYYYQLYLDKCELSLILQEKQIALKRSKEKQKEMGKKLFYQQQKTEEVESRLTQMSSTFSSRMNAIQSMPKRHRPTKSTVKDLASIEEQFRSLLKKDKKGKRMPKGDGGGGAGNDNAYLEQEIIDLKSRLSQNNEELLLIKQENHRLKLENGNLQSELNSKSKQDGVDQFYEERTNKLSAKVSGFQQNIYNLMSLLQNIEQEYMQKCGKLPKATKAIDWRNEYDPKKYKEKAPKSQHPTNQTFVIIENERDTQNKKKKKKKKHKDKALKNAAMLARSQTQQINISNVNQLNQEQQKHHDRSHNESRIIDL